MKKIIVSALTMMLFTTACKDKNTTKTEQTVKEQQEVFVDEYTSKNAIDWEGAYEGVLPCASCPGIETTIVLNQNGTFTKTTVYRETKDKGATVSGKFEWLSDGSKINLDDNTYLVGENQLFVLDANGKMIQGDLAENYILKKK